MILFDLKYLIKRTMVVIDYFVTRENECKYFSELSKFLSCMYE